MVVNMLQNLRLTFSYLIQIELRSFTKVIKRFKKQEHEVADLSTQLRCLLCDQKKIRKCCVVKNVWFLYFERVLKEVTTGEDCSCCRRVVATTQRYPSAERQPRRRILSVDLTVVDSSNNSLPNAKVSMLRADLKLRTYRQAVIHRLGLGQNSLCTNQKGHLLAEGTQNHTSSPLGGRFWMYDCGVIVMKFMELWDGFDKYKGKTMPDYTSEELQQFREKFVCDWIMDIDNVRRDEVLQQLGSL
ncbi:hypothetical protein V8G54_025050 [Vigna mungo]|uniref:Uncharacterized protein n=1 Tax=Vigna mungo TaxID=3915 RepID=A0AAQ3N710_VIGMU